MTDTSTVYLGQFTDDNAARLDDAAIIWWHKTHGRLMRLLWAQDWAPACSSNGPATTRPVGPPNGSLAPRLTEAPPRGVKLRWPKREAGRPQDTWRLTSGSRPVVRRLASTFKTGLVAP